MCIRDRGMKEDKASWVSFFQWLRGRGLDGVKLIVGDKCMGMLEAVGEAILQFFVKHYPCTVQMLIVDPHRKYKMTKQILRNNSVSYTHLWSWLGRLGQRSAQPGRHIIRNVG